MAVVNYGLNNGIDQSGVVITNAAPAVTYGCEVNIDLAKYPDKESAIIALEKISNVIIQNGYPG